MNPLGFRTVRMATVHEPTSLGLYDAEDVYAEQLEARCCHGREPSSSDAMRVVQPMLPRMLMNAYTTYDECVASKQCMTWLHVAYVRMRETNIESADQALMFLCRE
ncbi:hypothetical protein E2C01_012155 [Portunus trituberculatus]|uniref:Uncharacterized protein n=1 Tax=Portunus trituberculatus TaxID=210409 RepID=A0A5B7DD93_PORTR|nr:hypothetical protein [Portunus trituberculatus]